MSADLKEHAQSKGWWSPDRGEFDFAIAYSNDFEETELSPGETPSGSQLCSTKLLQEKSKGGELWLSYNSEHAAIFTYLHSIQLLL